MADEAVQREVIPGKKKSPWKKDPNVPPWKEEVSSYFQKERYSEPVGGGPSTRVSPPADDEYYNVVNQLKTPEAREKLTARYGEEGAFQRTKMVTEPASQSPDSDAPSNLRDASPEVDKIVGKPRGIPRLRDALIKLFGR